MHQTAAGRRHSVALIAVAAHRMAGVTESLRAGLCRCCDKGATTGTPPFPDSRELTPWRPRSAAPVGRKALLGRTNMRLLIGQQADRRLVRAIYARLGAAPEVQQVVDLPTMLTGTDKVLVCARAPSVL